MGSSVSEAAVVTGSVSDVPKVSETHEFMIRDYSRTKGMGVGKSILSDHFTVDGRKWYVRFYPDGYSAADSTFMALYVQTLYKPQLGTVLAEFSFQLLGPDGAAVYVRRCDRACKYNTFCNSWGLRRFISRNELEGAALGALNADSLTVRCTVHVLKDRRRSRAVPLPGLVEVPVPPSCHGENAMRFAASGKVPFDVRFNVGGVVFEAHRLVVAGQSPYFAGLLYGHGSEARSDLVDIKGIRPKAFKGVLHYIYHDELPEETMKGWNAEGITRQLLVVADMCLLERLKMMCARRLSDFIKATTVDTIMELAELYSCAELELACQNYLDRSSFPRRVYTTLRDLPKLLLLPAAVENNDNDDDNNEVARADE